MGHRYSAPAQAAACDMYRRGASVQQIVDAVSVPGSTISRATLYAWLRAASIPLRGPANKSKPGRLEKIAKMAQARGDATAGRVFGGLTRQRVAAIRAQVGVGTKRQARSERVLQVAGLLTAQARALAGGDLRLAASALRTAAILARPRKARRP